MTELGLKRRRVHCGGLELKRRKGKMDGLMDCCSSLRELVAFELTEN